MIHFDYGTEEWENGRAEKRGFALFFFTGETGFRVLEPTKTDEGGREGLLLLVRDGRWHVGAGRAAHNRAARCEAQNLSCRDTKWLIGTNR